MTSRVARPVALTVVVVVLAIVPLLAAVLLVRPAGLLGKEHQ